MHDASCAEARDRPDWQTERLDHFLASRDQTLYWVDGNHDNHGLLRGFSLLESGFAPISEQMIYLPRGARFRLDGRRRAAVLGGAASLDATSRRPGVDWWPGEAITSDDLNRLGSDRVDVLIGHDAPIGIPAIDRPLRTNPMGWPAEAIAYAQRVRQRFHRGFTAVRPALSISGHYHQASDQILGYVDSQDQGFASRVVTLDMLQHPGSACLAIMTPASLGLEFRTLDGAAVPSRPGVSELRPGMHGPWRVTTLRSVYLIDLDEGSLQRIPGPHAHPTVNDRARPLLTLEACKVGQRGYWTMQNDGPADPNEFYWQLTTVIHHIEPDPTDKRPPHAAEKGATPPQAGDAE